MSQVAVPMKINRDELLRQHREARLRRERLFPSRKVKIYRYDTHVWLWREHVVRKALSGTTELDVLERTPVLFRPAPRVLNLKSPRLRDIAAATSVYCNVSIMDILSDRRQANIVRARFAAMYLARRLTPTSYPEIGRQFGNKDHASVLHAVRRAEELIGTDRDFALAIRELTDRLGGAAE